MATVFMAAPARAQVHGVELPPLTESKTSNGLEVVAAQRGPIPLVSMALAIQGGSAVDPNGKEGLADFTAKLLRRGTQRRDADALNEAIEFVGGSLGISANEDLIQLSITAPSQHFEELLNILGELVTEPAFPEAEVASARERTLAHFANDLDDPSVLAERALVKAIWGPHPYGHDVQGSAKTVKTFTRDDVVRFHKERLGPKVATLVVVGDVAPQKVAAAAEKAFGRWTGGPDAPAQIPPVERPAMAGQVVIVDKPDASQTQVRIAAMGQKLGQPDHFPATMMNTVLGGGFTSRLMDEIRVNRGLSYGVSSYFDRLKAAGTFGISTFTKNASTEEIIDVALAQVKKLRSKGVTPRELKAAQTYVAGLFPLRTETNESIAGSILQIRLFGLGDDWISKFRERIFAVTPKQVSEVASRYLFAEPPTIVLVGKASEIRKQVEKYGPVKVIPIAELE